MDNLLQAAKKFGAIAVEYELLRIGCLEAGGKLFLKRAKAAMGTYEYGWPPLKQSTIDRKKRGDTPLVETEVMRESGGYTLHSHSVIVGFADPKILIHEYGTKHIEPRPVVGGTVAHHGKEIAHKIGVRFGEVFASSLLGGSLAAAIARYAGRE